MQVNKSPISATLNKFSHIWSSVLGMSSRHTEISLPPNQNHRKQSVSGEALSLIVVSYTDAFRKAGPVVSCLPSALANCMTLTCLQGEDCIDKTDGYYWLLMFYSSISADSSILRHLVYMGTG